MKTFAEASHLYDEIQTEVKEHGTQCPDDENAEICFYLKSRHGAALKDLSNKLYASLDPKSANYDQDLTNWSDLERWLT